MHPGQVIFPIPWPVLDLPVLFWKKNTTNNNGGDVGMCVPIMKNASFERPTPGGPGCPPGATGAPPNPPRSGVGSARWPPVASGRTPPRRAGNPRTRPPRSGPQKRRQRVARPIEKYRGYIYIYIYIIYIHIHIYNIHNIHIYIYRIYNYIYIYMYVYMNI